MAKNLIYNVATRNAMLDTLDGQVGAAGYLQIFAHTTTPTINAADGGTKLCSFALGNPAFGAAAAGAIGINSATLTDTAANASGAFKYYRIKANDTATGASSTIIQGTAGNGTSFDLNMDSASVTAGQEVKITALDITGGNAS